MLSKILWVVVMLGSLLGAVFLVFVLPEANGAPQEAAIAAVAIGCAVVPYCLARAVSEFKDNN